MISRAALGASLSGTIHTFWRLFPMLLGVLLLGCLVVPLLPQLIEMGLFGHGAFADALTAAGVATGQPVVSYLLAGELQHAGIGLIAATAFITAWITVGIISLLLEAHMLGWRFPLWRHLVPLVSSLLIAWSTVALLHVG